MNDLLSALRQETGEIHHTLHGHPLLKACQEELLDIDGYKRMLSAFFLPWQSLFPSIDMVPIQELKPCLTKRYQALNDDRHALNLHQPSADATLQGRSSLSEGEILGMCYALVGSSLGASQLQSNIHAALGPVPLSYMSISPKDAGWPILAGYLRKLQPSAYPKASDAAQNVFRQIQEGLSASLDATYEFESTEIAETGST